mgnify:CR=1 FL=1
MILLRNVASTAHKRVHTRAIVRSDQGSKKLDRFCLKRGLVELFFFLFSKNVLATSLGERRTNKCSDRTGLVTYENKNFSVRGADNLFVNVKRVVNICSKY